MFLVRSVANSFRGSRSSTVVDGRAEVSCERVLVAELVD
jgi:hypothetical protein